MSGELESLRDEQAVKRVSVMRRKPLESAQMRHFHRQESEALVILNRPGKIR